MESILYLLVTNYTDILLLGILTFIISLVAKNEKEVGYFKKIVGYALLGFLFPVGVIYRFFNNPIDNKASKNLVMLAGMFIGMSIISLASLNVL